MEILLSLVLAVSSDAAVERDEAARRAVAQLGADSQVALAKIVVRSVEPRDWPDAALGCPQPGVQYAHVVSHGYRVALGLGGIEHVYHVSGQIVVRCPDERSLAKADAAGPAIEGLRRAQRARDDLARRLGLPPAAIRIATYAPAASVGEFSTCGNEALAAGDVHVVDLVAKGRSYRYRVSEAAVAFCGRESGE